MKFEAYPYDDGTVRLHLEDDTWRTRNVHWKPILELRQRFNLSEDKTLDLVEELHWADILTSWNDDPVNPNQIADELALLDKATKKICEILREAESGDEARADIHREAVNTLAAYGEDWASEQPLSIPDWEQKGFFPYNDSKHKEVGAHNFISTWLRQAKDIRDMIQHAKAGGALKSRGKISRKGKRTIETQLMGRKLPTIYNRITGKKFGLSRNTDQQLNNSTGVLFVGLAGRAIGFNDFTPGRIEEAREVYKKASPKA
jgi:hypothetical protein